MSEPSTRPGEPQDMELQDPESEDVAPRDVEPEDVALGVTDSADAPPPSAPADSGLVLKILSGPQRGAEAKLSEGTYRIGQADDCDLVLSDTSVAPHHAALVLADGEIRLEAVDAGLIVDGSRLAGGEEAELTGAPVIGLGTTVIAIGTAGTDWSALALPTLPMDDRDVDTAELDPSEEGEAETAGDSLELANAPTFGEADAEQAAAPTGADAPGLDEGAATESAQETSDGERQEAASGRRSLWIAAASIAVLLIGLAAYSLWPRDPKDEAGAIAAASAQRSLLDAKTVVASSGMDDLEVSLGRDGKVVIEGYAKTAEEKERLTAALAAKGVEVDNRIWPIDVMMGDVRAVLDRLGGGSLEARHEGNGVVTISGYYSGSFSSDELGAIVRNEVPAVRSVQSGEDTLSAATADLRERIQKADLADFLSTTTDGATIIASGVLDPDQMEAWQAVREAFDAAMNGLPHLESHVRLRKLTAAGIESNESVTATPSSQGSESSRETEEDAGDFPRLKIQGVLGMSDGNHYALLDDGRRITKGDVLDGGFLVETIDTGKVVLRRGRDRKTYYVGERDG